MSKKILIEVEVKPMSDEVRAGDYVEYFGKTYQFVAFDFDDSIYLRDIETGEEKSYKWW